MKRYDLHTHTNFSPDSLIRPEKCVKIAKMANLNGIAITDHLTIGGALIAKKLNRDRNFEVIVGQEITTNHGDVIALYINETIRKRRMWDVFDSI
jgi:predicted metal-dependent phosphoesterase TrpH